MGLGEAAALAERELDATTAHMKATRDRLQAALVAGIPKVRAAPRRCSACSCRHLRLPAVARAAAGLNLLPFAVRSREMLQRPWLCCRCAQDRLRVNGPSDDALRLPNTLSVSILGLNAPQLLSQWRDQLAASAGSACLSSGTHVSTVLAAMGVDAAWGAGTFRFSTGRHTTLDEVDAAAALVVAEANKPLA